MLIFLLVLYGVWLATLFVLQDRMIFPGTFLRHDGDSDPRPPAAQQLWLETPDGTRTEAWFIPGAGVTAGAPGPLVVFAHGNGELIDDWPLMLSRYTNAGASLLLVEYRGYGRSTGKPSQRALVADFLAFYDRVVQRPDVDPQRVILHGRSVGGAVLTQLAAQRPAAAMVLESNFVSLSRMALGYLAPPFLLKHPFRSDRIIPTLDIPILILHGTRDEIIPAWHGRRLHELAQRSKLVEFEAGHNDFPPDFERYWAEILGFLREQGLLAREGRD